MGRKQQISKEIRIKYYPQLKQIIEEYGEWEVNLLELSKKWDIPKTTIHRWKDKIVEEIGPLDLNSFGRNIENTGISNIKLCQRLIRKAENTRDKTAAVRAWNDTVKCYTEFLESYGKKDKIAERLEVSGDEITAEKIAEIYDRVIKEQEEELEGQHEKESAE